MLRLLGLAISVGLADSMNPSTIAPALYLASGRSPRRNLVQFILGSGGIYLIGGELIVLGPGVALLALVPRPSPTTRYILEVIAGAVVLVAGAVLWRVRRRLSDRQLPTPRAGGRSAFLLGASIMGVELLTAFPYFAVIAAVVGSGLGLVQQVVLVAIYNVCFVLPLLLILATVVVAGDRAQVILGRARTFLERHWPVIVAGLVLLVGAFVTVLGVTGLLAQGSGDIESFSRHLRHLLTHG